MILRKANIYDTNDIAKVHSTVWKDFYGKYVTAEFMDKLGYEQRRKFWLKYITEGNIVFVMEEKLGAIIGFAVPQIKKNSAQLTCGEVIAHYMEADYQHKHYGTALLVACAKLFLKNNVPCMSVWIHRDNPATVFYRRLGGEEVDARIARLDNKDIVKVNYLWRDLEAFIQDNKNAMADVINEY